MRTLRTLISTGAVITTLCAGLATAPAADAADSPGPLPAGKALAEPGYYHVWEHTNRGGRECRWRANDDDWRDCGYWPARWNVNDKASSWWNNGYSGTLADVRVYEHIGYGGASTCAPNGSAGNIPWEWNDRISSHKWVTNCGF
ncbi:hypothetical protein CP973_22750 [Streptomyces albofaciens JCM 4342]|uniref:peptidase inhibitor family I36 protein n=1 Tax=Streptomyces albofaciens TaxID=66866 RepID=UPI00123B2F96|nr:peptidase inhibitor family I36 protein [Streptomyces albofaciens]KAA6212261.1 hypothetical protein CP973_22750 [Streptomyces albofaciens JCM 4342]